MIEIRGLEKRYGNLRALKGIDLTVKKNEIYGFIGPNGAGKSTTLKILATLIQDYFGSVHINGYSLDKDKDEVRKNIGFMPDVVGLYRSLYVWEYLDFFLRAYDVPVEKRKGIIDDCLSLVDLTGKRNSLVGQLSRGMSQRLLLAKTLVHNPQVLLLDEPASGLDPRARNELLALLKELKAMGKTILISSHILSELEDLCDTFGIIEAGNIICEGPLNEIQSVVEKGSIVSVTLLREVLDEDKELIMNISLVEEMTNNGKEIQLSLKGGEEEISIVLKELVSRGYPILSYTPKKYNLDEVFMKITKGEVQ